MAVDTTRGALTAAMRIIGSALGPQTEPPMPILLNNCGARDHARPYPSAEGTIAVYDLGCSGPQARQVFNLSRGTECIVVSYDAQGGIRFDWCSFSHEEIRPAPEGEDVRVLFGSPLRSEVLSKPKAAQTQPYAAFFDARGDFKRTPVIAEH